MRPESNVTNCQPAGGGVSDHAVSPARLLREATRSNGRVLLSQAEAEHLCAQRRVDQSLCVTFAGSVWSVARLPGVRVGLLVNCALSPAGDALHLRAAHAALPGIWASRIGLSRNPQHTCQPQCTPPNSGSATNSQAPAAPGAFLGAHAPSRPAPPPPATAQERKRGRRRGKGGAVPAAAASPIVLVIQLQQRTRRNKQGNGSSVASWQVTFKVGK